MSRSPWSVVMVRINRHLAIADRRSPSRTLRHFRATHPSPPLPATSIPSASSPRSASPRLASCKPYLAQSILSAPGISSALEGKLLVSVLAGATIAQLQGWVPESCTVVRAMPNTPARVSRVCCALVQIGWELTGT